MSAHPSFLDMLCPMHAVLAPDGLITQIGPTLHKIWPANSWIGTEFLEAFSITRPQHISSGAELASLLGAPLHLRLRHGPKIGMKGVVVPHPTPKAGVIVNLSFGISAVEAVQTYGLSSADFAPTDLTVEMLYLVEAKSVVMAASHHLNERLLEARSHAEQQAVTDALTGVENRRGFERFLDRLITRQAPFVLMQVDLDHFKAVNDTLGHDAGDRVLQKAAQIMRDTLRTRDLVARVGGDEFILVLEGHTTVDMINAIGSRIIAGVRDLTTGGGRDLTVGCSIGAVQSHDVDPPALQDLLKAADLALYDSKAAGRGRLTVFDLATHVLKPTNQPLDAAGAIAKPAE